MDATAGAGKDLVFIVGRQRSGTTVFRRLLVQAGALDCDEIFHGNLGRPNRFFAYVAARAETDRALIHPQNHMQLFRDFIAKLRREADGAVLAMDVKYFGLNLIPAREDVEGKRPFMVQYMAKNRAHVVHIVRRNKLRVHVSEEMSKTTGRWSAGQTRHLPQHKPRLTLDIGATLRMVGKLEALDQRVGRQLASLPGLARLDYEAMFRSDGLFSDRTVEIASAFMGGAELVRTPSNLRMNPEPLDALIENFSAVRAAFENTPHRWMLEEEAAAD
ncbi:MAG: hypothetical protein AAGC92_09930 [Pseudomonadota bacterium]